jgi:hypothetical protein
MEEAERTKKNSLRTERRIAAASGALLKEERIIVNTAKRVKEKLYFDF